MVLSTMDETEEWQVYDDLSSTIELLPCKARIGRLNTLFANTLYSGPENESTLDQQLSTTSPPTFYTFDQLLSIVQASQVELERALVDMNTFVLDNYHRCIDTAYLHQMLDGLATNATILGYDVRALSLEEAHACLDQDFATVPDPVRLAFLQAFMTDMTSSSLCLDNFKVARFLGSIVLEMEKGREWKLHDFMETWVKLTRLVLDMRPTLSVLEGLYYTTERQVLQQPQLYISYFPVSELPTDPAERFTRLFMEKSQWTANDIYPYINDLARDEKHRDALLLKFTRVQKVGNRSVYGSRIK
ncbi:unnamed protein product [Absidia cylindrospora]